MLEILLIAFLYVIPLILIWVGIIQNFKTGDSFELSAMLFVSLVPIANFVIGYLLFIEYIIKKIQKNLK